MRSRAPANVFLRRAQLIYMLAALVPTLLMTLLGIILLASGSRSVAIVAGVLVLTFCTLSLTAYILGSIFISRGASLARIQNDFLSSVSHELRTPLTSMRMFLDTLRDDRVKDPEQRRQCFEILDREMSRLDGLVTRLMDLSKIQSQAHAFERLPTAMGDVVDEALTAFRATTLSKEIPVELELEPGLETIGDRVALGRAVANLLINANKHNDKPEPHIRLEVRGIDRKHLQIMVSDNGPGIPELDRKRVFEHFERGTRAEADGVRGSGLGLSIVQAIVRAHKGSVELLADSAEGAQFVIQLPRKR